MVIIVLNNNSTPYSKSIASQIGAIFYLPSFEPIYPSEMEKELDEDQIDTFAFKAVEVLSKNNQNHEGMGIKKIP